MISSIILPAYIICILEVVYLICEKHLVIGNQYSARIEKAATISIMMLIAPVTVLAVALGLPRSTARIMFQTLPFLERYINQWKVDDIILSEAKPTTTSTDASTIKETDDHI